jgi:mono/diheme cytochrome c family protein
MFAERCSPCHGPSGKGDGVAAAALNPKPRNYTDKAWQASVTDEQIRKTIIYGGAAVGKSAVMPSSPDLDAKPEVVEGLVKMVRSFGGT